MKKEKGIIERKGELEKSYWATINEPNDKLCSLIRPMEAPS